MAVSEKQLAANRANAQKSTGPMDCTKTKFNGVKHGLTAQHALLPWEHHDDLDAIIESFELRFGPTDRFEILICKQAGEAYWRLERSLRIETGMFETMSNAEHRSADAHPGDLHAGHLEAIGFMKADHVMDRYRRYDAHLQRAFDRALARCEKMASLRKNQNQPPLPLSQPEPNPPKGDLKECFVKMPLPKKQRLDVHGTRFVPPRAKQVSTLVHQSDSNENKSGASCEIDHLGTPTHT